MKKFNIRNLSYAISTALAMCMTQYVAAADYKKIGDLEIYEAAEAEDGTATIVMMLDLSGSMGAIDRPQGALCFDGAYRKYPIEITDSIGNTVATTTLSLRNCKNSTTKAPVLVNDNGILSIENAYLDRLAAMKLGLISYLADGTRLSEKDKIGAGRFPNIAIGVPAKELTLEHRLRLIDYISGLAASGSTPTAAAYAEAGAYMMGTRASTAANGRGGGFSSSAADTKIGNRYQSPIVASNAQCSGDGYGIFFLTDGEPNGTGGAQALMNTSLGFPFNANAPVTATGGLSDVNTAYNAGWTFIGQYAPLLFSTSNPSGYEIRTATVGFGSVFSGFKTRDIIRKQVDGTMGATKVPDCNSVSSTDAKNLCLLGEYAGTDSDGNSTGGYGNGGFTSTGDAAGLSEAVRNFIQSLPPDNTLASTPSGTISVPADPLSTGGLQPYAYMPMLQVELIKATATWPGNLKKYHTIDGTLYGRDGTTRLYITKNGSEFPYAINPAAADIWQEASTVTSDNLDLTKGGTYSRLATPTTSNKSNTRTVYVEDRGQLVRVGISSGILDGFDKLSSDYSVLDKAYILHFLGFSSVSTTLEDYTTAGVISGNTPHEKLQTQINNFDPNGTRVLGGVHHSVPTLLAYKGQFDKKTGNISTTEGREDFVLYGSMDGALHMANASTGEEVFSFIPRKMFESDKQRAALSPSGVGTLGSPAFGVDAPWAVSARYTYDYSKSPVTVSLNAVAKSDTASAQPAGRMYTYGGLGMGGDGLYGLDLTNRDNPSLLFSLNKNTTGFSRMGQIQKKPITANIKTGANTFQEVLIFGGGYDMCYENPSFRFGMTEGDTNCTNKTEAYGNVVYMVNAETGALIASWGTADHADIKHSVVGEITTLDRNNNGYIDHLYFADLGGQLFRVDLVEGNSGNGIKRRTIKVFDANAGMPNTHLPYRFYEAPVASIYTDPTNASQRFAVVNVASGDRSSPLHKHRATNDANRVYGIIDRDVASARVTNSLTTNAQLISRNLTNANLVRLNGVTPTTDRDALINPMREQTGSIQAKYGNTTVNIPTYDRMGWYYDLVNYDGMTNVPNLKALGPGMVTGSVYYSSVYSPDYQYGSADQCSAKIVGGTEYQMYCMPWGICPTNDTATPSPDGTLGYTPAGPGIRELAMASYTTEADQNSSFRVLLGLQTTAERAAQAGQDRVNTGGQFVGDAANQVKPGGGGLTGGGGTGGSGAIHKPIINATGYHLKVDRWYDLQSEEND